MRDTKSLLLLLVSLLLVLVSFVLIWTWGYRFYHKDDAYNVNAKILITDSNALANRIGDSLQKIYNETLYKLDTQLDSTLINSDSLKKQLDIRLGEFFRLSNEITAILNRRNNNNSNVDFNMAKQKIGELQNKVEDIRDKNTVVENENKRLGDILEQERKAEKKPEKTVNQKTFESNVTVEKKEVVNTVFTASDLKLSAIMITDDTEAETNAADKAEKLMGSFAVVNYSSQLTNAEMVIVVLQPDGRVLKTSGWESGTFNTPVGKKVYSYKLNFNYSKGEVKQLQFSLKADKLTKGNYTMEVYYNGTVVGRMVKTLS